MRNEHNLSFALENVHTKCTFQLSELIIDKEGKGYNSCSFLLNEKIVIYREAIITPKKNGQFVAVWKRNEQGSTVPYHINDNFDVMIIVAKTNNHFGQFIFPKAALVQNGIISSNVKEGKRGFRLYPTWDVVVSNQAIKTQKWQSKYFANGSNLEDIDIDKLISLLTNTT